MWVQLISLKIHCWLLHIIRVYTWVIWINLFIGVHSVCDKEQVGDAVDENDLIIFEDLFVEEFNNVGFHNSMRNNGEFGDFFSSVFIFSHDDIHKKNNILKVLFILDVLWHFFKHLKNDLTFQSPKLFCICFFSNKLC